MAQSGTLLLGQYKVIRILHRQENYAAALAVDILDRQQNMRLLNIYEGAAVRRYAPVFECLRHCPDFLGVRLDRGTLIAIFNYYDLPRIDSVFFGGSDQDRETRIDFAEKLFRLTLSVWDQPPEIGCAAMLNTNLCVMPMDNKFHVNFCVIPTQEKLTPREVICLTGDQAKKILLEEWKTELPERRFLLELVGGCYKDAIALNSAWNIARGQIEEAYKKRADQGPLGRLFGRLVMNIRWKREAKESIYGK